MEPIYMIDDDTGSAICHTPEQQAALEAVGYRACTYGEYYERCRYQYRLDIQATRERVLSVRAEEV